MSAAAEEVLISLRPMQEKDLDELIQIEHASYEFPWSAGIYKDCLMTGYCCWVIEFMGRIAGYGIMSVAAGESHILNICVKEELQNQGLGRKMLEQLLWVAKGHNAQTTFLEVRPSNGAAIYLYESTGFSEVGSRRNYYPAKQGREDAIIFAKELRNL